MEEHMIYKQSSKTNHIEESDIVTTFGKIHMYKVGNGKQNILFLHGAGSDHALLSWREVLQHLPDDYTAYAIDLLGHGKSDKLVSHKKVTFYEVHTKIVDEVLTYLKLDQVFLVGLSMGGSIATLYTLQNEHKVKSLFLVNSWGFTKKIPFQLLNYWLVHHTSFTLKQFNWMAKSRALARWTIRYYLIGNKALITEQLIDEVIASCNNSYAGLAMQQFERNSILKKVCYPYLTYSLNQLTIPIVFISGRKDKLVPYQLIEHAAQHCSNGSMYILNQCKHWAVKEQPFQLIDILKKFE